MFNTVLGGIVENEKVDVYSQTSVQKDNGSESIKWVKTKTILCNIQANKKYGDSLAASMSGDTVTAVYNLYTKSEVEIGQRVIRDGIIYEIRNVEHNGIKTILEHYKAYLTRVDNQVMRIQDAEDDNI